MGKEIWKLRDIQRYSKVRIKADFIPSDRDLEEIRVLQVLNKVKQTIEKEDLDIYRVRAQEMMERIILPSYRSSPALHDGRGSVENTRDNLTSTRARKKREKQQASPSPGIVPATGLLIRKPEIVLPPPQGDRDRRSYTH